MELFVKQKMGKLGELLEYYTLFLIRGKGYTEVSLEILLDLPEISRLTKDIDVVRYV